MTLHRVLPITREWPLATAAETRAIEGAAATGLAPTTLMQRAGASVAALALATAPHARRVWLAAGPGNNGGDALEAAIHLAQRGCHVEVSLHGEAAARPADARAAFDRARAAGVHIDAGGTAPAVAPDLAIDGLLGVGASRPAQAEIAASINVLNSLGALACPILAIDLPSGLHADTGQALGGLAVRATHSLALLTLKPGMFTAEGRDHIGTAWFDALGVEAAAGAPGALLSGALLSGAAPVGGTPPRRHAQHKGSFGDVAVIGGAPGMEGAGVLAARAAHAAGAGRVFLELLSGGALAFDPLHPELMLRAGGSRGSPERLARTTVVCGCGGGDAVRALLPMLLRRAGRLVLDADALNAIAADASIALQLRARAARGQPTVLTPHPLEAARLLGCTSAEVQADRLAAARELAQRHACVIVLKGSGTLIAAPGQPLRINATGNASLASAGTGDVLAGWLGGRWAQCARGSEAATALAVAVTVAVRAVAEHGAAADPAPAGALRATDLIERLHRG